MGIGPVKPVGNQPIHRDVDVTRGLVIGSEETDVAAREILAQIAEAKADEASTIGLPRQIPKSIHDRATDFEQLIGDIYQAAKKTGVVASEAMQRLFGFFKQVEQNDMSSLNGRAHTGSAKPRNRRGSI